MAFLNGRKFVILTFALVISMIGFWSSAAYGQKMISYQTEDGWTIYGTYFAPEGTGGIPAPAVLMLTDPGWDVRSNYNAPARPIAKKGIAALAIDVRGMGQSVGGKHFGGIAFAEQKKIPLDIKGALRFLASQKEVDPHRIVLMGTGVTADYAALEAAESAEVEALVFISGTLSPAAQDVIKARDNLPILMLAGKNDRPGLKDMAEVYALSKNENSELLLGLGRGTVMFSHMPELADQVADWLVANVTSLGAAKEISFKTEDGWVLHGRLRLPDLKEGSKVPGVVFVHGANHDQGTYYDLARAATQKGLATLTYDWRGKNQDPEEANRMMEQLAANQQGASNRQNVHLDVKAAIQFLASQKGVDANRIGLVAATAGVTHAVQAAVADPRVKTMAILSVSSLPSPEGQKYLSTSNVSIFAVASSEDVYPSGSLSDNARKVYEMSANKRSHFLLFKDAGRGSEMLKHRPELQSMVARWLAEELRGTNVVEGSLRQ